MTQSPTSLIRIARFAPEAQSLRKHFDERFRDPRHIRADRFVWDYWHVPDQYTVLRTPAYEFFPKRTYRAFHERLVRWGRENLGCHDVSPPWMSLYVDGFHQNLHADVPHGPWAYVFSLTPWKKRKFSGGETLMIKENVLSYWKQGRFVRENEDIFETIAPEFNQLTVFDPRIPHGVKRVEGVHDPREGRLVIHGWFVNPRPFISGPLREKELQSLIDELILRFDRESLVPEDTRGVLSLRFLVGRDGRTLATRILTNTLRASPEASARIVQVVRSFVANRRFPPQKGTSQVTLPLIFE